MFKEQFPSWQMLGDSLESFVQIAHILLSKINPLTCNFTLLPYLAPFLSAYLSSAALTRSAVMA